jgi:hypothetical protein
VIFKEPPCKRRTGGIKSRPFYISKNGTTMPLYEAKLFLAKMKAESYFETAMLDIKDFTIVKVNIQEVKG